MASGDWQGRKVDPDASVYPGELNNTFVIRGRGMWSGSAEVQSILSPYGVCCYKCWDPSPPAWRFLFETYLNQRQVLAVLGHIVQRWQVTID